MARRKSGSIWTGVGPDPTPEAAPGAGEELRAYDRPARSDHRARMIDLKELANRLAKLPQGVRRRLPLDDEIQEQLDRLASADPTPERRRLVMRAKLLLGGVDLDRLHAALEGDTPAAAADREAEAWCSRIIAGDDTVLQAFVEAWPGADRQSLRANAREARADGGARARSRLLRLLRAAMDA